MPCFPALKIAVQVLTPVNQCETVDPQRLPQASLTPLPSNNAELLLQQCDNGLSSSQHSML